MERRRPPMHLDLPDAGNQAHLNLTLASEGLTIKRGMLRFDIAHDDVLLLLRWLLWHALYGWWKPRG